MLSSLLFTAALLGQPPAEAVETHGPPSVGLTAAPAPDRWLLMKALQGTWEGAVLDANRMQVYGWADMAFTASSNSKLNLPMGQNFLANDYMLLQNWIRFERTVVTSGTTEPTFGFRSDWILPGTDYRFTLARGLFNNQLTGDHGDPNLYGIDPIAFYAEGYFPTIARGLDVKVGHFFAQIGVESNEAVSNYLASHSYTFIYDPFTQTGVLTTTQLTPALSFQAGMVLGSDVFVGPEDVPTFIGNLKWAPPSGPDAVTFNVIIGPGRFNPGREFHNPNVFDLINVHQLGPRLTHTFEALYGYSTNVTSSLLPGGEGAGGRFVNWVGVLNYLNYVLTPRLSTTARLEFFDDFQGQRTQFPGLYTDFTLGLMFKPWKSVIFRPELRYDYNGDSRPFEEKHWLITSAFDVIVRW